MDIYDKLYAVERDIEGKTPAERLAVRCSRCKPLMKKLHKKVLALKGTLNPTERVWSTLTPRNRAELKEFAELQPETFKERTFYGSLVRRSELPSPDLNANETSLIRAG